MIRVLKDGFKEKRNEGYDKSEFIFCREMLHVRKKESDVIANRTNNI